MKNSELLQLADFQVRIRSNWIDGDLLTSILF